MTTHVKMKARLAKIGRRGLITMAGAALCGQALAQTVSDNSVPDIGLNIPESSQILGNGPRNIYRPTAIVNGEIITATDVEQRIAMLKMINGQEVPEDQLAGLRQVVFQNLVDEKLKIQEARTRDMAVTDAEVEAQYARVAASLKMSVADLNNKLRAAGSNPESMRQQIRGEFAWERLLGRNVEPYTNVSDDEVQAIIAKLTAARGTEEHRVGEIYFSANAQNEQQVFENAKRVIQQIQQEGDFAGIASRVSEATTRSVGGDLGWLSLSKLPESMAEPLSRMQPGQIAGPLPVPGGYSILFLIDRRKVLTADMRDAKLSIKQISLDFPAGISQEKATELTSNFANTVNRMAGCGGAEAAAASLGATIKTQDALPMRNLPPQLQSVLATMQIGQATSIFGSTEEGISTLVLCGRDMPGEVAMPKSEDIEESLRNEKVEKRAQRYLRDLRRDAIIEFS